METKVVVVKNVDVDDDDDVDDRPRTPIITGPIIELRGREVLFAISVFFLTAIVVGLIVVLASNKVKELDEEQVSQAVKCDREEQLQKKLDVCKEEANRYCLTSDCVLTTSDVLHRMDLTVNPCHDFWKYSCGGWLQAHQDEPVDRESWGIEDEVEANIRQYIRRLLESPAQCDDDYVTADCKMRLLYARCMDTETIDVVGAQPLQDILDDFGGWSALADWNLGEKSGLWQTQRVLEKLQFIYRVDAFFTINVVADEFSDNTNMIQIVPLDPSRLGLGGRIYYSYNDTHPRIEAYKNYMRTIAALLNATDTDRTEEFIRNTIAVERQLAQMQDDENESTLLVNDLQRISQRIKWLRFLRNMSETVMPDTPVLVRNNKFLSDVSRLLQTTDEGHINGYLGWRLISQLAAPFLSQPFNDAYHAYRQQVEERPAFSDRAAFCQSVVNEYFGKAVLASLNEDYLNNDTRAAVDEMVENIKDVVSRTLTASHWMDEKSRRIAIEKLNALQFHAGKSPHQPNETDVDINDFYDSFEVSSNCSFFDIILNGQKYRHLMQVEVLENSTQRDKWSVSAYDVKAFYLPTRNAIGITAGVLQPPYFDINSRAFLNYGALGSTIAREMTLAFNEEGSKYAKDGSSDTSLSWWSDDTWDKFKRETYCFSGFYSNYKVNCISINGELTLESNIADVGGLRIAYKAYKDWVAKNNRPEIQLPDKNVTNEQFFFVAFAQKYCMKRKRESIKTFMRTSNTSLEEIRVKGAVSLLDEFAATFNCPFDTKMHPRHTCLIW